MALYSLREGVRYDVIHAHYWLSGWVAELSRRYWNTPFVQMFHTTAHMKNAVSAEADHETEQRSQIEKRLLQLANGIIAANPDERADLIWRMGVPTEKVCAIPPGVDLELFRPHDRAEARARDRTAKRRGQSSFSSAASTRSRGSIRWSTRPSSCSAANHRRNGPSSPSSAVTSRHGEPVGPLARVAETIAERGLTSDFLLLGSQPQDQLPLYYSAADVVAVPSRYESFGLVAVEALACGVPVVASRAGGLRFTIDEGESGLLVKPQSPEALANGLETILGDDRLRASDGQRNARPSVARYDWTAIARAGHPRLPPPGSRPPRPPLRQRRHLRRHRQRLTVSRSRINPGTAP